MAPVSIQLDSDYGYVVLDIILVFILNNYLMFHVLRARKTYDVQPPNLYSATSYEFNCIQRVHQNTLEVLPQFMAFLLIGGLYLPKLSALFGLIFIISRVFYAHGYYTFVPGNRSWGEFGYVGLLGVVITTLLCGIKLLGWI